MPKRQVADDVALGLTFFGATLITAWSYLALRYLAPEISSGMAAVLAILTWFSLMASIWLSIWLTSEIVLSTRIDCNKTWGAYTISRLIQIH